MNKLYRLLRYDWPMHFVLLATNWLPDNVVFIRLRGKLAAPFFKACGNKLGLGRNIVFYNPSQISIGDNVYIAYNCWFSASGEIILKDEVLLGPSVIVASSNHNRVNDSYRFGAGIEKPIFIGKGSWIGGNSTITAGSEIGSGSVVGANSVVFGKIEDNSMFGGSPGKKIRTFE